MLLFWLLAGLVALVAGAESLVRGASRLALRLGLTPLVVGLTVVAFGTSAPELAVVVQADVSGQPGMALGNIVGSNIFNVLVVLGASALITPLVVQRQLVRVDVPLLVGVSVVFWLMAADGFVGRLDGLLLTAGVFAYTFIAVRLGRRDMAGEATGRDAAPPDGRLRLVLYTAQMLVGLGLLVVGADWLVFGAAGIARAFNVSDAIIGLTIVAAGTSLPEVATSIVAALRGERDMAVGNVVGSGLFNLLAIGGLGALMSPTGLAVPDALTRFDLPVMVAVAAACLPIFAAGHRIGRWEGGLFLAYYAAYVAYLVMAATAHDALPAFSGVMAGFVLPLTAVTLLVLWSRGRRRPASPAEWKVADDAR
jgi:cation:H+ antiporter